MRRSSGTVVLAACVGIQLFTGILYVWSIVKDQFVALYGWSATEATLPYTVSIVISSVTMFVAGLIHDHKGPRHMLSIGTVLLGTGLMLMGVTTSVTMAVFAFGVVVGVGVGINNMATTPAAVKWFPPKRKGAITGLVVASIAVASLLYTPVIRYLMAQYGLKYAFLILGAAVLILSFTLAQFVVNPPQDHPYSAEVKASRDETCWRDVLRTSSFYKLFLMFTLSASSGLMIIGHLSGIVRLQSGWEGGYLLILLIAVFNAVGRLVGGVISDKIGRLLLMRIVFITQAINVAMFLVYRSIPTLVIGVMVAGTSYGATSSAFPAITADYYGLKSFGANFGLLYMAWGLGGIFGPLMAGVVVDQTGRYDMAYLIAAMMLVVATVISFSLKEKRHPDYRRMPFHTNI